MEWLDVRKSFFEMQRKDRYEPTACDPKRETPEEQSALQDELSGDSA